MPAVSNTQDLISKSDIKILVVDDKEDNLFSIETILEKDNYVVVKANSGREALKILLNEFDFALIYSTYRFFDHSRSNFRRNS